MTKRKRNEILNLGSFANLSKRRRKSKKPCCDSGENLDIENEQEIVLEKTAFHLSLAFDSKIIGIGSSSGWGRPGKCRRNNRYMDFRNADLPHDLYGSWMHIGRGSTVVKQHGRLKSIAVSVLFRPPFWLIWRRHLFESTHFHCKSDHLHFKYFTYLHFIYLNNLSILLFVFWSWMFSNEHSNAPARRRAHVGRASHTSVTIT